ncbi:MAG: hypothetical protein KUG81_04185 [Gammaproteobacteria bacterium]|nr:hypothetical protein [Gammaproteobacteria bacterium]
MQEHYGITDAEFKGLVKSGVTDGDLYRAVKFFDPNGSGVPLGKVSLLYYIDSKGDFNSPPTKLKHKLIAKALFKSLDLKSSEKMMILEYIEDANDGEF